MRTTALLLLFASLLLLTACKKETDAQTTPSDPSPSASISDFSKLAVGNYWVYERVKIDSMGNDLGAPYSEDSVYVAGDTVLDGQTWFMLGGWYGSSVARPMRDSVDCLIDQYLGILYCSDRFDEVLQTDSDAAPNSLVLHWYITSAQETIVVPAGTYDCHQVTADWMTYGTFTSFYLPSWKRPRRYWASGVGKVQWFDFYAASNEGYRYDLVRYHVQ